MTSSIPIPQGDENNVVLTPRYTRLGWDTSTDLNWTDYDVNTRIEVDFFNGNTSGVFGSYDWRMRFAWIEFGPLLVGQAASVFMDYDVFPNVLDYQGPPGMILMRQGLARIKFPVYGDDTTLALGVEQPYSDIQWEENGEFVVNPGTGIITDPDLDRNVQNMPDFTGNFRHDYDYGHVQAAGIFRLISFSEADTGDEFNEARLRRKPHGNLAPLCLVHRLQPEVYKLSDSHAKEPVPWRNMPLAKESIGISKIQTDWV